MQLYNNSNNLELDAILCQVNTKVYNPKENFWTWLINKIESILFNKTIEKFDFNNLKIINFTVIMINSITKLIQIIIKIKI